MSTTRPTESFLLFYRFQPGDEKDGDEDLSVHDGEGKLGGGEAYLQCRPSHDNQIWMPNIVGGAIEAPNAKWLKRLTPQPFSNIVGCMSRPPPNPKINSTRSLAYQIRAQSDRIEINEL